MRTKFMPFVVTALVGFSSAALLLANATEPMMKAAVLHEHGGPEVLKYEDTLRPEPKDDEILVKVMAAGVNPVDTYIRQGMRSKTASSTIRSGFAPSLAIAFKMDAAPIETPCSTTG